MAKVTGLVGELRKQVSDLENDLRARVDGPDEFVHQAGVGEDWRAEHLAALKAERTAASWQEWRDERLTQAAVAWVLLTVFARFCEDNELVSKVWIAGPTRERRQEALDARRAYFQANPEHNDRDWLNEIVTHFASIGATAGLVDKYSPLHQVAPSGDAARRLLEFWWEQDSDNALLRRFGSDVNPDLDTRFLGDLYQDMSEFAKKTYALLQTPEFVEEFILDQTFEPSLAERPLEGFSVIDPTCGSGHFLLGAFARLLDRWSRHAPNLDSRALVQKALDGVHGVDINPFAVEIARFRLIVAALKATGELSLEKAPGFELNLANGDSLIYGARKQVLGNDLFDLDGGEQFSYSTENRKLLKEILRDSYDVVVGNPPYITVKDKAQNAAYRELYSYCKGPYALTVPFMELFFDLARRGEGSGWIGQITSNSFMKRNFGGPIVEKFLARQDLRLVIDTSGAYIPGHGTPTVILIGRNRSSVDGTVRAVLGVRGEPGVPSIAAKGLVWQSIVDHVDKPGFDNGWITVVDVERAVFANHPWSLSGGSAISVRQKIDSAGVAVISTISDEIGYVSVPRDDAAFTIGEASLRRSRIDRRYWKLMIDGDSNRDWSESDPGYVIWPYNESDLSVSGDPMTKKVLWPCKAILSRRVAFGKSQIERDLAWYEYSMLFRSKYSSDFLIAFSNVGTHNHFLLDRKNRIFDQHSPVIKLPKDASVDSYLELLGLLNSSVACFWLKQNSHDKGNEGYQSGMKSEFWERFFEFTATTIKDFPLPSNLSAERARQIDALAEQLARQTPYVVANKAELTWGRLDAARVEHERIRAQMVAVQEELDWEVYQLYGLIKEDLTYSGDLPGLNLGERAFEIDLARMMKDGEDTAWFERHRSTPTVEIPEHWSADYRDLVQRRLDVIGTNKNIRLLEKPEYKRRWAIEPWDKRVQVALKDWLLDKLEDRALWFDRQGRPRPRSVAQLADELGRDSDFTGVLELWAGRPDIPVATSLQDLLADQAVPFLAAYRYKEPGLEKRAAWEETWRLQRKEDAGEKLEAPIAVPPKYKPADFVKKEYWQHRGKLDVPKERFILYSDAARETDATPLLGWAGWDHAQQALALATIMNDREQEGWSDERMIPLVAGIAELQPWVRQWHNEVDPTYGTNMADYMDEILRFRAERAGKTIEQLAAWRPVAPTRGRRKAAAKSVTQGSDA